jgi:hypothetical protein
MAVTVRVKRNQCARLRCGQSIRLQAGNPDHGFPLEYEAAAVKYPRTMALELTIP